MSSIIFKRILKLGVAAVALYYAYQIYDVYYGSNDMYRDGFGKKFRHQVLNKGDYDTWPSPTKPAPDRLTGPYDPKAVEELMNRDPYFGTNFPKVDYSKPMFREKTEEERKQARAQGLKEFARLGIDISDPPRTLLYDYHRRVELIKNCVEPPFKSGYGYHVTCCDGWEKTVIRTVAYFKHMTMAEAAKEVKTHTNKNGYYETDLYVFERHYADCPEKGERYSRQPEYLYVKQDIPDSLAYASRKTPPSIQRVAQKTWE